MLHLVGILFPHINDDARSKSHQETYQVDLAALTQVLEILLNFLLQIEDDI